MHNISHRGSFALSRDPEHLPLGRLAACIVAPGMASPASGEGRAKRNKVYSDVKLARAPAENMGGFTAGHPDAAMLALARAAKEVQGFLAYDLESCH
jgi:hypothetical protein